MPPPAPPAQKPATAPTAASLAASARPDFHCTEVIGLSVTAEWYEAGFEQLVDDARFQARTRPHTFVDQWADPTHEAWSAPVTSPCATQSQTPDRVVLFAANWQLESLAQWTEVLERAVATLRSRYPTLHAIELFTVLRGPRNQSCGEPKSVVDPVVDAAIAAVAKAHPTLVQAGPQLEAPDCSVFEKGGPHFTESGRRTAARIMAEALR